MFAKRNSFTLALIWLLMLAVGIGWYMKDANEVIELVEQRESLTKKLTVSRSEIKRLTEVETIYKEKDAKWANSSKRIISADEPAFSLSYINWIITSHNLREVYYDFVLNRKTPSGNYTRFIYTLNGEGTYQDIFKLIWFLTYEPILYKINSLSLKRTNANFEFLKFSMQLEGFTVDSQSETIDDFTKYRPQEAMQASVGRDIFKPLLTLASTKPVAVSAPAPPPKPQLPPKQEGEIDAEKASLKAVAGNTIFISEGKNQMVQLRVGDPVYLGELVDINQQRNEATFVITKFGIQERIVLRISERN